MFKLELDGVGASGSGIRWCWGSLWMELAGLKFVEAETHWSLGSLGLGLAGVELITKLYCNNDIK